MSLLEVRALSKAYGGVEAAKNVSFTVKTHELVALIGPNGAGKSTTFHMIGGQIKPDKGRVTLVGKDVTGLPPRLLLRHGLARTFQVAETFRSMSVLENVQMASLAHQRRGFAMTTRLSGLDREEAFHILDEVGLAHQAATLTAHLAYGDVKRVELAMALATKPLMLLMDEPMAGMGPEERLMLMELVRDCARRQTLGILFTEHDMDSVFGFADRVIVLVRGQIIKDGSPDEVRRDEAVRTHYLGNAGATA
jgi:branched-chain amino acid transport system ATP-binding protein